MDSMSSEPPLWVYGTHTVLEALKNPRRRVICVVATAPLERLPSKQDLFPYKDLFEVRDKAWFARLFGETAVHQGLCAQVMPFSPTSFESLLTPGPRACVLALDQLTDPQNIGASLRSVAALGGDAVLVPAHGAPPLTPAISKSACGALEHVALLSVPNLAQALGRLKKAGYWCIGLASEERHLFSELPEIERAVMVVGGEGKGLRALTRKCCDFLVRLPTVPSFPTLNAAQSATIALYEWSRRQGGVR
ncbi:MAG: RNA methyltransferase [Holosporales bacterium]|nr:RNA methyltransferase [Holosporales bacterium]